jgi:NAD(P)-dependent dehydrogenase (short-subunit alcohol dehydrogenase family)
LRSGSWGSAAPPRHDGGVVVITAATGGIGLAAAEGFAALGAHVRLLARSAERGEAARARIAERTGSTDVTVHICDVSLVASVHACVASLAGVVPQIDVLVNNAGVLPARRVATRRGGGADLRH